MTFFAIMYPDQFKEVMAKAAFERGTIVRVIRGKHEGAIGEVEMISGFQVFVSVMGDTFWTDEENLMALDRYKFRH